MSQSNSDTGPREAQPRQQNEAQPRQQNAAQPRALPFWAAALDLLGIALLLLAAYVAYHGGFVLHVADSYISIRSAWRPLLWATVVLGARHALRRRPALHERVVAAWRWFLRVQAHPPQDDVFDTGRASTAAAAANWRRAALWSVGVVGLYAALTLAMTYPQVRVLDRGVSVDIGDPLLSTWRLAWVAHQLPIDPWHLFDANIFYPERATLAFSDSMIVPGLMAAPFLWLGVPQLLVYNVLLLAGFALSGAAMFLLVRALTRHTGAAVVAGFVFAFLPYRYMHYAHLELQMTQWMPLCLWAMHRTVTGGRVRDGILTGILVALQTLSSFYYGIFFVTFLVPVAAALFWSIRGPRVWPALRALTAGAVLSAAIVAPFVQPYLKARQSVGERQDYEVEFYSATPENYLAAHGRNIMFGERTKGLGAQERELFQGIAVPIIAVVGLWPPLSMARIGYALGLATAFELSLGTNGFGYPLLREYLLPYRGLRVPARMAILVGLSLAILVGYGVARLSRRARPGWRRHAIVVGLAALIFAEYRSELVLKDIWRDPPAVYAALASEPDAVLFELPLIAPDIALEPVYMYFSTFHWHRMINGYSGFSPPSYRTLIEKTRTFPDAGSLDEIRRRGVSHVVVHGAFYDNAQLAALTARLSASPDLALVQMTRWDGSPTWLYRVLPARHADVSLASGR